MSLPMDSGYPIRDQWKTAREAAEALFKPKASSSVAQYAAPARESTSSGEPAPARKPRVFAMPEVKPPEKKHSEEASKSRPTRAPAQRKRIPPAQHNRIRVLVEYGMTIEEVAELYNVQHQVISPIVASAD